MTMQRWEEVYNELQRKSERIGFKPPTRIGGKDRRFSSFALARGRFYCSHSAIWLGKTITSFQTVFGLKVSNWCSSDSINSRKRAERSRRQPPLSSTILGTLLWL